MKFVCFALSLTTLSVVVAKFVLQNNATDLLKPSLNDSLYKYPTDFTQGIVPKPIHSHNDYWRDVPFFTGLSYGCISTEADVWLYNSTLYVGHMRSALKKERTFESLYVKPILETVKGQNPASEFVFGSSTKNGVFDTDHTQTLYLFVDLKTDGSATLPYVIKELQPLRDAGYLTSYNGSHVNYGPVTVIGTGNTPLNMIEENNRRDVFFDSQLTQLNTTQNNVTSDISLIASTDFEAAVGTISGNFSDEQIEKIQSLIAGAKSKGIGARFWNTPAWPISTRDAVWKVLVDQGVALLNADDLASAAGFGGSAAW